MTAKLLPIMLVVASCVSYQLAQRSMSVAANPFAVVALVYALGIVACFALAPLVARPIGIADVHLLRDWPPWLLAASVVGIEVGYLLVYRTGWSLGTTVGVTYTLTIVLVAVIGATFFAEVLSLRRVAGLLFALAGLWLLLAPSHVPR